MCVSETANYRQLLMRDNMNGKSLSRQGKRYSPVLIGVVAFVFGE